MIPDKGEIIKFDAEGNSATKERLFAGLRRFLDSPLYTLIVVIIVGLISFQLGLLVNLESHKQPITITEPVPAESSASKAPAPTLKGVQQGSHAGGGTLVAAKTGTKYYYPWCGNAARIKEANKIYFASVAEARAKGYTPAANCKGLE